MTDQNDPRPLSVIDLSGGKLHPRDEWDVDPESRKIAGSDDQVKNLIMSHMYHYAGRVVTCNSSGITIESKRSNQAIEQLPESASLTYDADNGRKIIILVMRG